MLGVKDWWLTGERHCVIALTVSCLATKRLVFGFEIPTREDDVATTYKCLSNVTPTQLSHDVTFTSDVSLARPFQISRQNLSERETPREPKRTRRVILPIRC